MKFHLSMVISMRLRCRAPQGARGLKSELPDEVIDAMLVAPRKGRVG